MDTHSTDPASSPAKLFAAAADRNKEPILAVLRAWLPKKEGGDTPQHLLEVAAGTGQHAPFFAARLDGRWAWHPTDGDASGLPSMRAHAADSDTVAEPTILDVANTPPERWPTPESDGGKWDAAFAGNLTHISPWAATKGLLRGAGATLRPGGRLLLYGPFAVDGAPATPSDAAFDASLRAQNPAWGYRDLRAEVIPAAAAAGLSWVETVPMPANNFTLVFEKKA